MKRARQVQSEGIIKRDTKKELIKLPVRFSRRIRRLPPESTDDKSESKCIISKESSVQFAPRSNKFRYPRKSRYSKEVLSILSAPKICRRKSGFKRHYAEIPVKVNTSSCRLKLLMDLNDSMVNLKKVKKESSPATEILLQQRKKYVLEVLNRGGLRDLEKLPSIGCKTAERIIMYRQLKGSINRISELALMPKFGLAHYNNFIAQNFLNVE